MFIRHAEHRKVRADAILIWYLNCFNLVLIRRTEHRSVWKDEIGA
jgi:hypothetical protein